MHSLDAKEIYQDVLSWLPDLLTLDQEALEVWFTFDIVVFKYNFFQCV